MTGMNLQEARQKAFNEGSKALLEGRDSDIQGINTPITRDIFRMLVHIRDNYQSEEDRRGKLMVVAAVEGLSQSLLIESGGWSKDELLSKLERAVAYYDGYDGSPAEAGLILRDSVVLVLGQGWPLHWAGWSDRTRKEILGE